MKNETFNHPHQKLIDLLLVFVALIVVVAIVPLIVPLIVPALMTIGSALIGAVIFTTKLAVTAAGFILFVQGIA